MPDISAKWLNMPTASQAGQIEITKDGVAPVVYFALPDLTPVANAATVKAGPMIVAAVPTATTFSTTAVEDPDEVWS